MMKIPKTFDGFTKEDKKQYIEIKTVKKLYYGTNKSKRKKSTKTRNVL
jgi:hypothetical protein